MNAKRCALAGNNLRTYVKAQLQVAMHRSLGVMVTAAKCAARAQADASCGFAALLDLHCIVQDIMHARQQ